MKRQRYWHSQADIVVEWINKWLYERRNEWIKDKQQKITQAFFSKMNGWILQCFNELMTE